MLQRYVRRGAPVKLSFEQLEHAVDCELMGSEAYVKDRLILLTGASGGIGRAAVLELARQGARLLLVCRDAQRGEAVRREVATLAGTPPELFLAELSDQDSIRALARDLRARHGRLDVLVNNAGTWAARRREGPQGLELTWATNVLAYSLLTELLLPLVAEARGRVLSVASRLAHGLQLDDVEFRRRRYNGIAAYAQSKQANRLWTWSLARRVEPLGVSAHALHPGGVSTGLFRKGGGLSGMLGAVYGWMFGRTPEQGADTLVWLSGAPEGGSTTGRFWVNRQERTCQFRDPRTEDRLYELCLRMAPADGSY